MFKKYLLFLISMLLVFVFCNNDPVSSSSSTDDDESGSVDSGTVTDINGNVYQTIKIGNQIWTRENIRTTSLNDGTPIPLVTDNQKWISLTTPGYCFYANTTNSDDKKKYGALYNWYTVNTKKLAPKGWHVPSIDECTTMRNYLIAHGYNYDGSTTGNKVAKSIASKSDWKGSDVPGAVGNNESSNNKSNFTAFPSGYRFTTGEFSNRGQNTQWWTTTPRTESNSYLMYIYFQYDSINTTDHSHANFEGGAVRLVKDN
jgi:uncharacterized protein (TIGR02145 family)